MKAKNDLSELSPRFKVSHFRSGDILLSTVQRSAVSAAIRSGTGSRFSHAAIHWKSFTFLEAIGAGVCTFNILVSAICDKKNVQVLRLKDEFGSGYLAKCAADAAYKLIGREYWVAGAIQAPLGVGSEDARGRLFCSYLVAQAFSEVGVQLCPNKRPQFVTPRDLSLSPLLVDITDSTVYEAEEFELREVVRLIDGHDPSTPQTEFRDAMSRLLSEIRSVFVRLGMRTPKSLPDVLAILVTEPDPAKQRVLDDHVSDILEKAAYAEFPTTILFREPQPSVGFDEKTLSELSLSALEATISTHRKMQYDWVASNAQRKKGLDAARQIYGHKLPFKTLEIQFRHEQAHWSAMEINITLLDREVGLMDQVRTRVVSGVAGNA